MRRKQPRRHQVGCRLTDEQLRWVGTLTHLLDPKASYAIALRAAVIVANSHRREWIAAMMDELADQPRPQR